MEQGLVLSQAAASPCYSESTPGTVITGIGQGKGNCPGFLKLGKVPT